MEGGGGERELKCISFSCSLHCLVQFYKPLLVNFTPLDADQFTRSYFFRFLMYEVYRTVYLRLICTCAFASLFSKWSDTVYFVNSLLHQHISLALMMYLKSSFS